MRTQCPGCRLVLVAPDDAVGRRAKCKGCGASFVIPPAEALPCPRCNAPLDPGAVLCHRCGTNLRTGRSPAEIGPEESAADLEEPRPSVLVEAVEYIGAYLPGLFRPWLLIRTILWSVAGIAAMGFCVFLVVLGAVIEACMVGGFGLILYAQGLAILIQGEAGLLHEILADMKSGQWLVFLALLFVPFAGFYFVLQHFLPH
jgi:hypothetical protein